MVELAQILLQISTSAHAKNSAHLENHSTRCNELTGRLDLWKDTLPNGIDFNLSPLDEGELVTKQKIVLKLRKSAVLWNERELISCRVLEC